MKHLFFLAVASAVAFPLLSGCADTSHQVTNTPEYPSQEGNTAATGDHVVACQKCYDQVKVIREEYAKGGLPPRNRVVRQHKCPDCMTTATFHTKDGVPVFKCAKCAPEGLACDKCLPPRTGS